MAKPNKPNKPKPSKVVAERAARNTQRGRGGNRMFGAVGGYGGVNKNMVRKLINATVRPEIMAMRDDRQFINRQANDALADENTQYGRIVSGLSNLFDTTGAFVGNMGQQINSGFQNTAQQVAGRDAGVAGQIDANAQAANQAIATALQNAGIAGMSPVGVDIAGDAAFAKDIAAQQAANNQTNIGMQQQSANTLSQMLGGMIQASKASNLGTASANHQTGVNDINRAKREDLATVNDAMQQLRASKPGMIREMLLQLQAQGFDQWSALQNLNMQRRQMKHGFAMDNAQMAQQNAYYGTSAQAWGSQAGAAPSSSGSSWSSSGSPSSSGPIKLAGPAANPVWTPNPPKPPKPPKKGGKNGGRNGGPRGGSPSGGSNVDSIYGPLW